MADTKITALTALTAADPINDVIPIVDVSDPSMAASGTTKKISVNNILSSSPTASGAFTVTGLVTAGSATITGAATVGTTLGVTGVSTFAAGTALLPALTTTGDTNTGVYYPAADTFAVTTGGTERYRVDSSGNVGIGVTPSASWVTYKALEFDTGIVSGSSSMALNRNCYFDGVNWRYKVTTSFGIAQYQLSGNGNHIWNIASSGNVGAAINGGTGAWTQAMTLTATGDLLVGTTSNTSFSSRIALSYDSGVTNWAVGPSVTTPTGFFISANVGAQGVYLANATATSWTAWSDERLKDIIEPINNAVFKVGSLRAVIGKFKNDNTNTRKPFLIAQDVLAVLPEAVDVSNPDSFGVSYTDVIPLLVAAIKELTARVQTLEAR